MNAYMCDACRKLFILPQDEETGVYQRIPMTIYISEDEPPTYQKSVDICDDCSKKILNLIDLINAGTRQEGES